MTAFDRQLMPSRRKPKQDSSVILVGTFFLTGVFVVLSFPLISDQAQSIRFLDLLGVIGLGYLAIFSVRQNLPPRIWLLCWISVSGLLLVFADAFSDTDAGRLSILGRLVFSIAGGIFLGNMAAKYSQIKALTIGAWCGAMVACLIAFGQSQGISSMIALAPIDRVESVIQGVVRPQAIWGHPNAAAQVTMAGAAMVLLAWNKSQGKIMLPVAMYAAVAILNYLIMQNRGPLIVGFLICLLVTVRHSQLHLRIVALLCVGFLAALIVFEPEILIGERWTATFSGKTTAEQAVERLRSTFAGLSIAFEAPLGHSPTEREARMLSENGIRASHNGYVFAALTIGPWVAAFFFFLLLSIFKPRDGHIFARSYGIALCSIGLLLLFEDSIFEPTVTTLLVLVATLSYLDRRLKPGLLKSSYQIKNGAILLK